MCLCPHSPPTTSQYTIAFSIFIKYTTFLLREAPFFFLCGHPSHMHRSRHSNPFKRLDLLGTSFLWKVSMQNRTDNKHKPGQHVTDDHSSGLAGPSYKNPPEPPSPLKDKGKNSPQDTEVETQQRGPSFQGRVGRRW